MGIAGNGPPVGERGVPPRLEPQVVDLQDEAVRARVATAVRCPVEVVAAVPGALHYLEGLGDNARGIGIGCAVRIGRGHQRERHVPLLVAERLSGQPEP
jgi:hypothetical protein